MIVQDLMAIDFKKTSNEIRKEARRFLKSYEGRGIDFSLTKKDGLKLIVKFDKNYSFGLQLGILDFLPYISRNSKGFKIIEVDTNGSSVFIEITDDITTIYSSNLEEFSSFSDALRFCYETYKF